METLLSSKLNSIKSLLPLQAIKAGGETIASGLGHVLEFKILNLISQLARGPLRDPKLERKFGSELRKEVFNLWLWDTRNILSGLYPEEVHRPLNVIERAQIFYEVLKDYPQVLRRRKHLKTKVDKSPYPDYFARTFHFQSDGYLSEKSAKLYDEQVEILFAGTADIMRRALLVELAPYRELISTASEILELAGGTGAGSRLINVAYPKARLTFSDISPYYVDHARAKLTNPFNKYHVLNAADTKLPSARYQLVFHIFLFHELPASERLKVLQEIKRLLVPGGVAIIIDSIQIKDRPEWSELLLDFPKRYHEPFYRNYLDWDMEAALMQVGLKLKKRSRYFLSTCWVIEN